MKCLSGWFSISLLASLSACAPAALPNNSASSSRSADYNGYTEDLSAVRPVYAAPAPNTATSRPVATAAKKPDVAVVKPVAKKPTTAIDRNYVDLSINRRLDIALDTMAQANRSVRYAPGFRIQIYVGNERQAAEEAKLQIYQTYPELSPYLAYKQPTYRLKIGDFMRRMDAEWYMSQIKQQFPSAIMQADKVDIRRSLLIK